MTVLCTDWQVEDVFNQNLHSRISEAVFDTPRVCVWLIWEEGRQLLPTCWRCSSIIHECTFIYLFVSCSFFVRHFVVVVICFCALNWSRRNARNCLGLLKMSISATKEIQPSPISDLSYFENHYFSFISFRLWTC